MKYKFVAVVVAVLTSPFCFAGPKAKALKKLSEWSQEAPVERSRLHIHGADAVKDIESALRSAPPGYAIDTPNFKRVYQSANEGKSGVLSTVEIKSDGSVVKYKYAVDDLGTTPDTVQITENGIDRLSAKKFGHLISNSNYYVEEVGDQPIRFLSDVKLSSGLSESKVKLVGDRRLDIKLNRTIAGSLVTNRGTFTLPAGIPGRIANYHFDPSVYKLKVMVVENGPKVTEYSYVMEPIDDSATMKAPVRKGAQILKPEELAQSGLLAELKVLKSTVPSSSRSATRGVNIDQVAPATQ